MKPKYRADWALRIYALGVGILTLLCVLGIVVPTLLALPNPYEGGFAVVGGASIVALLWVAK